jgi:hypothetical protein
MSGSKKGHIKKRKENGKLATGRPEIWTKQHVKKELDWMLHHLQSPEGQDIVLKKELCIIRQYSYHVFSIELSKYTEFLSFIKRIEDILETRLYKAALTNDVNPTMAIFGLKNHYAWKDKTESEITGKDGKDLIPRIGKDNPDSVIYE